MALTYVPRTDWDWIIYPQGLYDQIMRVKKRLPKLQKSTSQRMVLDTKMSLWMGQSTMMDRIDYVKKHMEVIADTNL